jgi:hypothetical protein
MLNRKLITYCLAFATAMATHHTKAAEQTDHKYMVGLLGKDQISDRWRIEAFQIGVRIQSIPTHLEQAMSWLRSAEDELHLLATKWESVPGMQGLVNKNSKYSRNRASALENLAELERNSPGLQVRSDGEILATIQDLRDNMSTEHNERETAVRKTIASRLPDFCTAFKREPVTQDWLDRYK